MLQIRPYAVFKNIILDQLCCSYCINTYNMNNIKFQVGIKHLTYLASSTSNQTLGEKPFIFIKKLLGLIINPVKQQTLIKNTSDSITY